MRTHTFPFVHHGDLAVEADILVPENPKSFPVPVLIWYHGGGLVQGNRKAVAAHHKRAVDELGVAIVSPDYRLTPQIRVPELQEDLVALMNYVSNGLQADLERTGETTKLDLNRLALTGSSAGGWIAFWIGLGMLPGLEPAILSNIRAIAPIYPITTMDHPFFLEKQTPFLGRLSNPESDFTPFKSTTAPVISNTAEIPMRNKMYMHAQQEALFPTLLFSKEQIEQGWLQKTDVNQYIENESTPEQRSKWAPIYMIHGALDSAVDIDQARLAKKALDKVGVNAVLEERPDKDHLWDLLEPEEKFEGYWQFLSKHLHL